MKKLVVILFLIISVSKNYSQENSIIGKWKVVSAETKDFYLDTKKDTIIVSEKIKKWYPTKVGMQNELAYIKMNHSNKVVIFTDKNEFYEYLSESAKSAIFTGKYSINNDNKIELDVINSAKISLKKEAEFYFKDGLLHMTLHTETNSPIKYILERIN